MPMCSRVGRSLFPRVQVVGQEYRAIVHFQPAFPVRLGIAYLIGGRLGVTTSHRLPADFGGFTYFHGQRFRRERVSLLDGQTGITLFSNCKAHGIDIRTRLDDTFKRLPLEKYVDSLLPCNFLK